jgi:hypothetical protein
MVTYFREKTIDCKIPEKVLDEVRDTFTAFSVTTEVDGTVTIKVPENEHAVVERFRDELFTKLVEMRKENDVLAGKLARRHGF